MKGLKIGIQLYTVRELLQDDFKGTLAKLAELGFNGVEFAWNYGGMSPEELKAYLDDLGLETCGLHTSLDNLLNPDCDDYKYALALGCKYITTSLQNEVEKDWLGTVEKVNEAAKVADSKGLIFTYHNHAQEFAKLEGECALDLFYAKTDPQLTNAELDTFWIKKGGNDPVTYLEKYKDRLPQIHTKDMDAATQTFTPLGSGIIDFEGVKKVAEAGITEWLIYEQDSCGDNDVLDCVTQSANFLKKLVNS